LLIIGNLGGVPHSLFSLAEAQQIPPYNQYWRDEFYDTLNSYINTGKFKPVNQTRPDQCEVTFEHLNYGKMYYAVGDKFLQVAKKIYGKQRSNEVIEYLNDLYT
jgi:hypothetical protein